MKVRSLTVCSTHKELEHVLSFLDRVGKQENWPPALHEKILLAGSEAATNAMDHGNHFDPEKRVRIEVILNSNAVVLNVEDEGEGFTRDEVDDPLAMENLLRDRGRGLFIIEQTADEISYLDGGRRLCLRFDVPKDEED